MYTTSWDQLRKTQRRLTKIVVRVTDICALIGPRSTCQPGEVLADELLVGLVRPDRAPLRVGALSEVGEDQLQLRRGQAVEKSHSRVQLSTQAALLILCHQTALYSEHLGKLFELSRTAGELG